MKGNTTPRNLKGYSIKNNVASRLTKHGMEEHVEDLNIGSKDEPRMIKLPKGIPLQYKQRYLNLFKVYKDVFLGCIMI